MLVSGRHVEQSPGGGTNTSHFNRQVDIPSNVDLSSITSHISPQGVLTLESRGSDRSRTIQTTYEQRSSGGSPTTQHYEQRTVGGSPHSQTQHYEQRTVGWSPHSQTQLYEQQTVGGSPFSQTQHYEQRSTTTGDPFSQGHEQRVTTAGDPYSHGYEFSQPSASNETSSSPHGPVSRSPQPLYPERPNMVDTDYGRKLQMTVDVGLNLRPDDITVTLMTRQINVVSRHVTTTGNRTSTREITREFELPERMENSTVVVMLDSAAGVLYVGGSVRDNGDHNGISQLVLLDMPPGAQPCRTTMLSN